MPTPYLLTNIDTDTNIGDDTNIGPDTNTDTDTNTNTDIDTNTVRPRPTVRGKSGGTGFSWAQGRLPASCLWGSDSEPGSPGATLDEPRGQKARPG